MNQRDFGCEFAASNDSNLVIEAHTDDYIDNNVVCQDDCLILYTIPDNENETQNFDIVLRINIDNAYNEVHRIHRTNDEDNGLWLFCQLRDKFPLLVQCVPEIGTSKLLLQNISELIQENPSWTTAHIAAYLGYAVCFKNEFIQSQVNISCESTLQTPLHVAVEAQQLSSVMALMDLNVRIDCQDAHGNTPLHLAAITTKDIIQALSNKLAKNVINMFNYEGYTALQLACMADQTDCIAEFLKIGDAACLTENNTFSTCDSSSRETENLLNNLNNPTTSSVTECKETPLHSCETPEEMIELVEHGHDINAKNSEGDTALHVMVKYNRFACSVVLLSHEADVDVQDFDGNTPLHLAILYDFPSLVKALIVFGANVNKLNYFGESPRHLAATDRDYGNAEILYALHIVGAKRCSTPRNSCKHGCTEYGEFNGIPPENCAFSKTTETVFEDILTSSGFNVNRRERRSRSNPGCQSEDSSKGIRVLSLDGGGIRGLILIQMLDQLEKVLGKPVVHCFDFIAGTSTGGILALALATAPE